MPLLPLLLYSLTYTTKPNPGMYPFDELFLHVAISDFNSLLNTIVLLRHELSCSNLLPTEFPTQSYTAGRVHIRSSLT